MTKSFASFPGTALLLTAPVAPPFSAQSNMVFVSNGSLFDGHYFVGPYTATQDGQLITVHCVDFFHDVNPPSVWSANFSAVTGDLSNTRFGDAEAYKKAAYLTTLYN